MDIGLYREDEQFLFSSSYLESYSSDSTSFKTIGHTELFEDLKPSSLPPNELFEWHDDIENVTSCDTDLIPLSSDSQKEEETPCVPHTSEENVQKMLGLQNWQPFWPKVDVPHDASNLIQNDVQLPIESSPCSPILQEILELPEIANTLVLPDIAAENIVEFSSICHTENKLTDSNCTSSRVSESSDVLNNSFSSTDLTNFDIAEYVFEENKQSIQSMPLFEPVPIKKEADVEWALPQVTSEKSRRMVKAGVKKIDMKARKYIIDEDDVLRSEDEDDVDIETISEEESAPVLEAGNLTDLLEQFEANEAKNQTQMSPSYGSVPHQNISLNVKVEVKTESDISSCSTIKNDSDIKKGNETIKIKKGKPEISNEKDLSGITRQAKEFSKASKILDTSKSIKVDLSVGQESTTFLKTSNISNNRNIDTLPQEVINRIKESGKRKPITVIQAIPTNKKRGKVQETPKQLEKSSNTVHLDHNYCSSSNGSVNLQSSIKKESIIKKEPIIKKESNVLSSEEDDRTIINRQPTVKNADGTLMVSLLKANTIHQMDSSANQKKKLNLEEYKKRRKVIVTPSGSTNSPNTSSSTSPVPEDEHQKMLKHQEKLKKMAEEVLNAAPKSEKKPDISNTTIQIPTLTPLSPLPSNTLPQLIPIKKEVQIKNEILIKTEDLIEPIVVANNVPTKIEVFKTLDPPKLPPNLERKVLVSFGVNTDFKISKNDDPLSPVEKLQEIKPLLEKVSDKINENSLIASVIENIPKVIGINEKPSSVRTVSTSAQYEHGENKQVLHLEKNRIKSETKDAATQTNISLIEQTKRGRIRRRLSSDSSCSSSHSKASNSSKRSRKSSVSSSSSSSSYSSRSSTSSRYSHYSSRLSYSRSRSRSPRYKRKRDSSAERDHLNAVEERRIIYVGRISITTTKEDLRKKFQKFGPINKISLHFREIGENYGFVTFKYKEDAHEAYEHGNDDPSYPYYKISFGGRREFCKAAYSDLDNMRDDTYYQSKTSGDSYDQLLKEALEKLKKRKA